MLAMISCRHASELMSQRMERKLKLGEKLRLQAHLLICKSCPKTMQQFEILREAGKRYAEHQASSQETDLNLSADGRQRILHKLQQKSDSSDK